MNTTLRIAALSALVISLLLPQTIRAQGAYAEALGGLSWGASPGDVLALHREQIMDQYRLDIAGIRDPIVIDRMRRDAERVVREIEQGITRFDGARTGYEVSVLQDELRTGAGMSMMTVRDAHTTRHYIFVHDALGKMVVTFDQASLGFIGFEPFVDQLSAALGSPTETEWRRDDIGVRHLARAIWTDGETRVRSEDKSRMFASFIVVYGDATLDDTGAQASDAGPGGSVNRPASSRSVGDMMRRIDPGEERQRDNAAIVDNLIGGPVEVQLRVRTDEEVFGPDGERLDGGSALDEDESLSDVEQEARPRRTTPSRAEEEAEEDEDGGLIY